MSRPSLDTLVPLMMIQNTSSDDANETSRCEPAKELLRHFASGDLVLVRLDTQCLPAIVFNISGLVMKFDIDRQLYHTCLLDKEYTERWVDAIDMITYSVPMIAECDDQEIVLMWSTANDLLQIPNNQGKQNRLEEFRRRFSEVRPQPTSLASVNHARKCRRTNSSQRRTTSTKQIISSPLTICEELLIVESIHRASACPYAEAKLRAEDTYRKIVCTNNRENLDTCPIDIIPDQWFPLLISRQIDHFRQYATLWLPDLEAIAATDENSAHLRSFIALMEGSVG